MLKVFWVILVVALMAGGVATASEPIGIEVRKRSAIGRLGLVRVQVAVKKEADGSLVVSFQAPEEGTYVLNYTSGPDNGKVAATIRVQKPGPVTTKIRPTKP